MGDFEMEFSGDFRRGIETDTHNSPLEDDIAFLNRMAAQIAALREATAAHGEAFFREMNDLAGATPAPQPTAPQARKFLSAAKFVDLILEPEAAESAIGDLAEGFQRRAPLDGGHAIRWLWAQVAWLTFNRVLNVVRRVVRARAGK